jgi:hypothetical protein
VPGLWNDTSTSKARRMASPPNKPRDIKNLKARLGRTITPGQTGAAPSAPGFPGAAPQGAPVSGLPGTMPTPAPGSLPAPGRMGSPLSSPSGGLPPPVMGGGVPQPAVGPMSQRAAPNPMASAPAAAPRSPFGGHAVAMEKKVTLVIDSSAVNEEEIGRKSSTRSAMLVGIGTLVGVAVGWAIAGTASENIQYNLAVQDGTAIYDSVDKASKTMEIVRTRLKAAVEAAQGGPGKATTVDYKAIEDLVALERPFSANEFSRLRYKAFPAQVVDQLFEYYNNGNLIFDRLATLGAKTAGEKKRAALDASAKATDGLLDSQYGMVLTKTEEVFAGGLVYVTQAEPVEGAPAPEEGAAPKVQVASSQGGRTVEREIFIGQEDFAEKYGNYVLMLDKGRSMSILGEQASLFAKLRADLMELNAIMTKTNESQGVLLKELGKVRSLEQRSFF